MNGNIDAVLFDLDGTLADTGPDLAHALNCVLLEAGHAPLPYDRIRPVVSHGGSALLRLGFGEHLPEEEFASRLQHFLSIYQQNIALHTRLFSGMEEVLQTIEGRGLKWGVVTNKPAWLTEPLLSELRLLQRSAATVSGDTLEQKKPHPAPLLHACSQIGCEPDRCIYVGDARRDIEAGRNAGMHTLVALFGYLGDEDHPENWMADASIAKPEELLAFL